MPNMKNDAMKSRNRYADILKGIGIIAIVIGHSSAFYIGGFVYSFHLMIFAFIAGYLYKEENAKTPARYLYKRVKKQYLLFVIYEIIFIVLHNPLLMIGLIPGKKYSLNQTILIIGKVFLLQNNEELLRPFWFIPWYLISIVIFELIQYCSIKVKNRKTFSLIAFALSLVVAVLIYTIELWMPYRLQVSFLSVPVIYMGMMSKTYWNRFTKYINWGGVLLSVILLLIIGKIYGSIDLAVNKLNITLFYPTTIIGIYFCLGFAKLIESHSVIGDIMAYIGCYSFHIMALHFLVFKIIDRIYAYMFQIKDIGKINRIPCSQFPVHVFYWLFGILIPIVVLAIIRTLVQRILNNCYIKRMRLPLH